MKYSYNKNAFNKILTEQDAYWLGFLLADGYISDGKKPFVQLKLGAKDYQHLKKFCDYLQYDNYDVIKEVYGGSYTKDNLCYVVKISCKQLSENLKQYGLYGAKSQKEKPYLLNNIELEKHYIRGIIDGDGWIRSTQAGFGVCGSYETMEYIKNYIHSNIVNVSNNNITKHETIYKFELTSSVKTELILKYFYQDANIYLDRKYKLFLDQYYK
jgi:hypothetical protein